MGGEGGAPFFFLLAFFDELMANRGADGTT